MARASGFILLLAKILLGCPLQRTIEQLRLYDLHPASGTMTAGMPRVEPLLKPIDEALRDRNVQSTVDHADETRWLVFTEKQGKNSYRWWKPTGSANVYQQNDVSPFFQGQSGH